MRTILTSILSLSALCSTAKTASADIEQYVGKKRRGYGFTHLELDKATQQLSVFDSSGRWRKVQRGKWTLIPISLTPEGYFFWKDGRNLQKCRPGSIWSNYVYVYHSPNSRRIIWRCYRTGTQTFRRWSTVRDAATAQISIKRADGRYIAIPRGRWITVPVRIDAYNRFLWKDGNRVQRSKIWGGTTHIKVYHEPNGRQIFWKPFGWF